MRNNENQQKLKININDLILESRQKQKYLKICAPMVRYSKLEFRKLVKKYGVDICFTPMIIAKSFHESAEARKAEFTTSLDDTPLIAQFAANNSYDLCKASELIYPYVDGIDINCGCPQKWAISDGYGCALLKEPELLYDMIRTFKRQISNVSDNFTFSLKIRLLQKDVKHTIDLCRKLESCGITFLTIHGRTPWQKSSEPVNIEAIADLKKSLRIPLIANGGVYSLNDANNLYNLTKCDGIMAANGLLLNPTLFQGTQKTTIYCLQDWLNIVYLAGDSMPFQNFHHHFAFMMEKLLKKKQRIVFNDFHNREQIYDFLLETFNICPQINTDSVIQKNDEIYIESLYDRKIIFDSSKNNDGKFFNDFRQKIVLDQEQESCDSLDFMDTTMFDL